MRRPLPILFTFLLIPSTAIGAQWQVTGETGLSRLKQAGLAEANAFTLGVSAERGTERVLFRSSVLGALADGDRWTGQWLTIGSAVTPSWNSAQLQITGALSAFGQTTLQPTSS